MRTIIRYTRHHLAVTAAKLEEGAVSVNSRRRKALVDIFRHVGNT